MAGTDQDLQVEMAGKNGGPPPQARRRQGRADGSGDRTLCARRQHRHAAPTAPSQEEA